MILKRRILHCIAFGPRTSIQLPCQCRTPSPPYLSWWLKLCMYLLPEVGDPSSPPGSALYFKQERFHSLSRAHEISHTQRTGNGALRHKSRFDDRGALLLNPSIYVCEWLHISCSRSTHLISTSLILSNSSAMFIPR